MVLQNGNYRITGGGGAAAPFLIFPNLPGNPFMAAAGRNVVTVTGGLGGFMLEVNSSNGQVVLGLYSATQDAEDLIGANQNNRTLFQVFDVAGGAANTYTIQKVVMGGANLALERVGNEIRFRASTGNANQIWTFTPA